MHKLYKGKSRKTKLTGLYYISDKSHSDSKLCQKVIILIWLGVCSNFRTIMILHYKKTHDSTVSINQLYNLAGIF